jgi:signal transduction histidine kinase
MAWIVSVIGNATVAVAYAFIAFFIGRGLSQTNQWRRNRLAVATCLIFASCSLGHALHAEHLLFGSSVAHGVDLRDLTATWHGALLETATASIAVYYVTLRNRYGILLAGNRLFDDLDDRQRTALEVHDDVIQGLVSAKLALDLGDVGEASRVIEQALGNTRRMVDRLMVPIAASGGIRPGDLRRQRPAGQP